MHPPGSEQNCSHLDRTLFPARHRHRATSRRTISFHRPDCMFEAMSEQLARADQLCSQRDRQANMVLHQTPVPPKVLVVEDEMMLRMRAVDIVEDAGFTPIEAVNADEALVILESRSDIELLFTDIQMPGSMDGLKLAHAVHERWPSIKIILVSGKLTLTEAEKPIHSRFFGKPLEVKQMIAEIQEMIGQGSLNIIQADISPVLAKAAHSEPRKISETARSNGSAS